MMEETEVRGSRRTLLAALWRYPWTVAVFVTAFLALALGYQSVTEQEYATTAGLVIDDPRGPAPFEVTDLSRPSTQTSERYLADQVEILRSTVAAEVASELTGGELTAEEILANREITGDEASSLISITFSADEPEIAKLGADSLAEAYMELHRRQIQQTATTALEEIDNLLAAADRDIEAVSQRIDEELATNPAMAQLREQMQLAIEQLNQLRIQRNAAPLGSVTRQQLNDQIAELLTDFETWNVALEASPENSRLDALLEERNALITERATLAARRNAITVDAEVAASGVALFSPAPLPDEPAGPGLPIIILIALALGLATAVLVAYWLMLRSDDVEDSEGAEEVLAAPLLAEIPRFGDERIKSSLPIWTHPHSRSADAFRLAATALDVRADAAGARALAVMAARGGSGTTTMVANTALAAAAAGLDILVVDADRAQHLSRLLGGEQSGGWTALARGRAPQEALRSIRVAEGGRVDVLAAGGEGEEEFLRSQEIASLFSRLRMDYDRVLVDSPPMLESATAATLARYVDATVLVVPEGSGTEELEDVDRRLHLIGSPILGFLYVVGVGDRDHRRPPQPTGLSPKGTDQRGERVAQNEMVITFSSPNRVRQTG